MKTTDAQVRKLMMEMSKHGRLGVAAERSGMDRKTARKYVREGRLPSDLAQPRWWRTRKNPVCRWDELSGGSRPARRKQCVIVPQNGGCRDKAASWAPQRRIGAEYGVRPLQ